MYKCTMSHHVLRVRLENNGSHADTDQDASLGPGYSISYNPHPDPGRGSGALVKHLESIRLSYENAKVRPHLHVSPEKNYF